MKKHSKISSHIMKTKTKTVEEIYLCPSLICTIWRANTNLGDLAKAILKTVLKLRARQTHHTGGQSCSSRFIC